jgi:hypothetical protein
LEKRPPVEELRMDIIEMLGKNCTVEELRKYGGLGLEFTMRLFDQNKHEVVSTTVKFADVLPHYGAHNF